MRDTIKVAAVQYDVTGGLSFAQFLAKTESFIKSAAQEKADLVVFPELFSADLFSDPSPGGFADASDENRDIRQIVSDYTPQFFKWIQHISKIYNISVLGGTIPELKAGNQIANTAILAFPDSPPVFQSKVFLTTCERIDWNWTAGTELKIIETPWGPTVIAICYDAEIPTLSDQLAKHSPELILVPSCTGSIHGFYRVRWTAQARAIEHYAYVLHTGTVGPGTKTPNMNTQYGRASIITPSDEGFERILAEGPLNKTAIIYADLNLKLLRTARKTTRVYPARDQLQRRH